MPKAELLLCSSTDLGSGSRERACPNRTPNQESRHGRKGSACVLVTCDMWAVKEKGVGHTLLAGTMALPFSVSCKQNVCVLTW